MDFTSSESWVPDGTSQHESKLGHLLTPLDALELGPLSLFLWEKGCSFSWHVFRFFYATARPGYCFSSRSGFGFPLSTSFAGVSFIQEFKVYLLELQES